MKNNSRKVAAGILIAVLLVLASVGGVMAASAGERSVERGNVLTKGLGWRHGGWGPDADGVIDRIAFWRLVATNLGSTAMDPDNAGTQRRGLDRATVQTAMKSAKAQLLAEAVAAGTITQAEADEMTSRHDRGWGHRPGRDYLLPDFIDADQLKRLVAETLDVTVEELDAAQAEGKAGWETLNIDRGSFHNATRNAMQQLVDEAVAAGTITQAEADEMTSRHDRGWGHRPGRDYLLPDFIDADQLKRLVAETLDVTVEELDAAQAEGKAGWETLNIDRGSFHNATRNAMQQLADEAVAAGTITQTEAEELMQGRNHWGRHDHGRPRYFHRHYRTVEPNA